MTLPRSTRLVVLALAICLLLAAFAVRVHLLGAQSLWHDEGNSYVQSTRTALEIAANAGRDIHPPGYYWLLGAWRLLTGEREFALRLLSAFASLLSIAFTVALGRRLFGQWVGLLAGLFIALNTFSLYYAQEARMYALLAMWAAGAMWALAGFLKALSVGRSSGRSSAEPLRWALALAGLNAAGLWTQYAFAFVMLAQGSVFALWWLGRLRPPRAGALAAYIGLNLLTLLLYAPWSPAALRQITTWPNTGQAIAPADALPVILGWLAFGITTPQGTTLSAAFFLVFGLLVFPKAENPRASTLAPTTRLLFPVLWAAVPVGMFLAMGLYREANLKFLLPAQSGFALWLARGVWMLWFLPIRRDSALARVVPRMAAALGTVALVSGLWSGLPALYADPQYQRDDYRGLVARLTAEAPPTAAVILNAPNQREVFDYYARGAFTLYPLPRGLGGDDAATRAEVEALLADHARVYVVLWGEGERDPNAVVENTLDRAAYEIDSTWYGGVRLVRYAAGPAAPAVTVMGAQFGSAIRLREAALSATDLAPGDVLRLDLRWEALAAPGTRYKVFVQLLNADGVLVAQRDAEPGGGTAPTVGWAAGTITLDRHGLEIPAALPPGEYRLIAGLYEADNPRVRLLPSAPGTGDFLPLAAITIRQP